MPETTQGLQVLLAQQRGLPYPILKPENNKNHNKFNSRLASNKNYIFLIHFQVKLNIINL